MRYCPTARNFYRIRRILMEMLGLPRNAIRPTSTFAELIPPQECQRICQRLKEEKITDLYLQLSSAKERLLSLIWLAILFAVECGLFYSLGEEAFGMSLVIAVLMGIIGYIFVLAWATKRWGTEFDTTYSLKRAVISITRFRDYVEAGYPVTREFIALRVREIVSRNLGVSMEMVKDETSFQEDIGAD
jgi:hypothetical protein